jgi:hypothetical protein
MTGPSFATRIALLLSMLAVGACLLVTALNYLKFEQLLLAQQRRVIATIGADLADTFERGMTIGVRLAETPGAQALLDRAFARDADLRRIAVAEPGGRILFDTERVRIGGEIDAALLAGGAIRRDGLDWTGLPLVNSFGQAEGTLLLGYGRSGIADRLAAIALAMAGPGLLALAIGLPLGWLAVFAAARPVRRLFADIAAQLAGQAPASAAHALHDAIQGHGAVLDDAARSLEAIAARPPERAA